jgi:hypothetical protein
MRRTHRLLIAATDNPDATVTFNFASSTDLLTQINEGRRPTSTLPPTRST